LGDLTGDGALYGTHERTDLVSWPGFYSRPVTGNRGSPVPVYRTGLTGYRSEQVEFKFEFKKRSSTGSYRYTGRFDWFTGRFDRFDWFTGRFDRFDWFTGRFDRFTGRFDW
jgi:hypothetical protein